MANELHHLFEEKYPGLSRGIFGNNSNSG
ncbi:hypothetical protein [Halalkalibacter alkalisediminis]